MAIVHRDSTIFNRQWGLFELPH